jgi:hypothetical protein
MPKMALRLRRERAMTLSWMGQRLRLGTKPACRAGKPGRDENWMQEKVNNTPLLPLT